MKVKFSYLLLFLLFSIGLKAEQFYPSTDDLTSYARGLYEAQHLNNILFVVIAFLLLLILTIVFILLRSRNDTNRNLNKIKQLKKQVDEEVLFSAQLEEVIAEQEKLSLVARKSENAIVIFSSEGEIEWINQGFTDLYGYSYEEFIIERGRSITKASYSSDIQQKLDQCIQSRKPLTYVTRIANKDKEMLWVQTTLTPVFNDRNELSMLIAIDADISVLKSIEKKLRLHKAKMYDNLIYASRIQKAVLPDEELIKNYFPEHFIFYRPKEIVGGDFYWFFHQHGTSYIVVSDCTGHGVSGAFLSLIGIYLLKQIIIEMGITDSAEVLEHMNRELASSLSGRRGSDDMIEGMDMSFIAIDHENNVMTISGAHQSVFIERKGEVKVLKGDRYPIGMKGTGKIKFKKEMLPLENGDRIYLMSDGFIDQFGGVEGKKYLTSRWMSFLKSISKERMQQQVKLIESEFIDWKLIEEQVDDVLILGLEYKYVE